MLLIPAAEIPKLLPLPVAIPLMRKAFASISDGTAALAERQVLTLETGTGLLMGAAGSGVGMTGKLMAIMPGNRERGLPGSVGMLLLLDDVSGEPLALMDGAAAGRRNADQVTFFKSVGHAVYDLYAARAIYEAARAQGAGQSRQP